MQWGIYVFFACVYLHIGKGLILWGYRYCKSECMSLKLAHRLKKQLKKKLYTSKVKHLVKNEEVMIFKSV